VPDNQFQRNSLAHALLLYAFNERRFQMQLNRPSNFKVLAVSLIFSAFATMMPALRYEALAADKPEAEEVSIESQVPVEESTRSDESGQASGTKISDDTKKILVGCLLLCNPVGGILALWVGGAALTALVIFGPFILARHISKESAATPTAPAPEPAKEQQAENPQDCTPADEGS
jgi:hypothetical protein